MEKRNSHSEVTDRDIGINKDNNNELSKRIPQT